MKKSRNLPPKDAFYSELSEEHISEADYSHAQEVFKTFKCKNVADYMMLYCSLDVVLLCEAFPSVQENGHGTFSIGSCLLSR